VRAACPSIRAKPGQGKGGCAARRRLGFAGGFFAAYAKLTRFVWRDCDADAGRFTAPEPMGAKGGDKGWQAIRAGGPENRVDGITGVLRPEWEKPAGVRVIPPAATPRLTASRFLA